MYLAIDFIREWALVFNLSYISPVILRISAQMAFFHSFPRAVSFSLCSRKIGCYLEPIGVEIK